jgi:Tripartite ATP-independent periplasmic transporters, DctQ component
VSAAPKPRVTVRAARHLKWPRLDPFERGLMVLCALSLLGFAVVEVIDVVARNLRRPWLNANEFAAAFFVWGVFLGMGVAVRRDQHFRLTAISHTLRGARRTLVETFNRLVSVSERRRHEPSQRAEDRLGRTREVYRAHDPGAVGPRGLPSAAGRER